MGGAWIRTDVYIERTDEVNRRISYFVEIPDVATYINPVIEVTVGVGISNVILDIRNFTIREGV